MRLYVTALIAALLVFASAGPATAQPMADRVPANALVYVGWDGTDQHPDAYNKSHFKAVIDAGNFGKLFDQLTAAAEQRSGEAPPENAKQLAMSPMTRPWAMYVAMPDGSSDPEAINVGFMIDGGENAQGIEDALNRMKANAQEQNPGKQGQCEITRSGNIVTMLTSSGKAPLMKPVAGNAASFAASSKIEKSLVGSVGTPVGYMWADASKISTMLQDEIVANTEADRQDVLRKVWKSLGLDGVKSAAWVAGFQGEDWVNSAQLNAPSRTGLLGLFDQPVDAGMMKLVPQTATSVQAAHFDMAKLLKQLREAAANDPASGIDQMLMMAGGALGVDLENELFAGLGTQWVSYTDPSHNNMVGGFPAGAVIINKLRKPEEFGNTINKLNDAIRAQIDMAKQDQANAGMAANLQLVSADIDGVMVHSLATGSVAPSWAVADGHYYFGFYPRVVAAAAKSAKGGNSIADQAGFKQAMAAVKSQGQPVSIQYVDLTRTAEQAHQQMQTYIALMRMVTSQQDQTPILPPVETLMQHVKPAIAVTTVSDKGWHYRSVSPFPGASLLGPSAMPSDPQMMMQMMPLLQAMQGMRAGGQGHGPGDGHMH